MAISDEANNNVHKSIDWTMMSRVLDLRNILELTNHSFDYSIFPTKGFIHQRLEAVLHVLSEV